MPVDVYVPGCPPPPQAILAALFVAMGIREARARPEASRGPPFGSGHSFVMVMVETSASPVVGVKESANRPSETPTRRVRVSTVR